VGTEADLRAWFTGTGMAKIALDVRGVFAYFEAHKPSPPASSDEGRDRPPPGT
jgi:hypothetical protein